MQRLLSILATLLLVATAAHAEPRDGEERSEGVALGLSAGVTAGGSGLIVLSVLTENVIIGLVGVAGVLVGPTTGHAYADETWNTWLGVRIAGASVVGVGVAIAASNDGEYGNHGAYNNGVAIAAVGVAALGLGTIFEIATAPDAALRFNKRHELRRYWLVPMSTREPGLAFGGRF